MDIPFKHAVQFYQDDFVLCSRVARFLAEGARVGEPAIVIATASHRECIADCLRKGGLDVNMLRHDGMLQMLDADQTLAMFMVNGVPDRGCFMTSVGRIVEQTANLAGAGAIRAYGEMVDLLWKGGNPEGAIKLEVLWNQLATRYTFSLLCGYAMGNFYKQTATLGYLDVCAEHAHVFPAENGTLAIN
jgi:hypothetical protein